MNKVEPLSWLLGFYDLKMENVLVSGFTLCGQG